MHKRISHTTFLSVFILLVFLPVLVHLPFLFSGRLTQGEVIDVRVALPGDPYRKATPYVVVRYYSEKDTLTSTKPGKYAYSIGEKLDIVYSRKDPSDFIILSYAYIYNSIAAIIAGILLIFWIAAYYALRK